MKTIDYRDKVGGAILALSLVLGIGMAGITAQARDRSNGRWQRNDRPERDWRRNRNQDHNSARRDDRYDRNDRYGNNSGYYNNSAQIALKQGYQAGLSTGSSDARRVQSYNPRVHTTIRPLGRSSLEMASCRAMRQDFDSTVVIQQRRLP